MLHLFVPIIVIKQTEQSHNKFHKTLSLIVSLHVFILSPFFIHFFFNFIWALFAFIYYYRYFILLFLASRHTGSHTFYNKIASLFYFLIPCTNLCEISFLSLNIDSFVLIYGLRLFFINFTDCLGALHIRFFLKLFFFLALYQALI